MKPAHALSAWNRKILETFSRRTVTALRAALPLRLALPRIESFLAENVAKEAEKDGLVILSVATALAEGRTLDDEWGRQILAATKEIDRAFLARVTDFPIGIVIRYEAIEPVRRQRINALRDASSRILQAWGGPAVGRAAIRACLPGAELERLLLELMRLYALETKALSRSLRLPALLVPLREKLAQSLYDVMNEVAVRLAREVAAIVYPAVKQAVKQAVSQATRPIESTMV